MKGLFLDDERNPQDVKWIVYPDNVEWCVVRSAQEFRVKLHEQHFDIISFDYYLGPGEWDGSKALEFLCHAIAGEEHPMVEHVKFHSSADDMVKKMRQQWKEMCRLFDLRAQVKERRQCQNNP